MLEELLGLDKDFLGKNLIVIEPIKLDYLKFPSGNEKGAYEVYGDQVDIQREEYLRQ